MSSSRTWLTTVRRTFTRRGHEPGGRHRAVNAAEPSQAMDQDKADPPHGDYVGQPSTHEESGDIGERF